MFSLTDIIYLISVTTIIHTHIMPPYILIIRLFLYKTYPIAGYNNFYSIKIIMSEICGPSTYTPTGLMIFLYKERVGG